MKANVEFSLKGVSQQCFLILQAENLSYLRGENQYFSLCLERLRLRYDAMSPFVYVQGGTAL